MNQLQWKRRLVVGGVLIASGIGAGTAWAYTAPFATPPGVTLVDVSKLMDEGSPQFLWRRLGDGDGNPLYTYDADTGGKSSCYDDCAKEFPPYAADARAKASGDWAILVRDDHVKQWTYQGKPLYRYSRNDPMGEPQGARFQLIEAPAWHDPSSDVYTPKKGWRRAAFMPEKTAVMPTSVQLQSLEAAGGFGLVDAATQMSVYAVPASHKVSSDWQPVRAAALAVPVGDFSIVTRKEDGSRQWSYKGEALYTYAGDYAPGDANGAYTSDKSIQAALLYRNFDPPGVTVSDNVGRGPLMVTAKGVPLYYVSRFHATYGGREIAGGYSVSYNEIKSQGTRACRGDCTSSWKPLMADKGALSSGFWELMDRPEGKQWAFKGSPAYTFTGDKKPGDAEGNNRYVVVYGGANDQIAYADAGSDPHSPALKLGSLTMAEAVGAKPGERGSYIAGEGFTGAREAAAAGAPIQDLIPAQAQGQGAQAQGAQAQGAQAQGQDQPQAQGQAQGGAPARGGRGAQGGRAGAQGQARGGLGRGGPGDHGAGFYWHTLPMFDF